MSNGRNYLGKKVIKIPNQKEIRRKRSKIKKSESVITTHHRRPLSLDGKDRPWNISNISEEIHKAWTIVAGNMNAEQICNHINTYFKPRGLTLICKFINGNPCKKTGMCGSTNPKVMSYAWKVLFKNYTHFREKIDFINSVLLDPAYHFYIRE